jgi:hypothetical protein
LDIDIPGKKIKRYLNYNENRVHELKFINPHLDSGIDLEKECEAALDIIDQNAK